MIDGVCFSDSDRSGGPAVDGDIPSGQQGQTGIQAQHGVVVLPLRSLY